VLRYPTLEVQRVGDGSSSPCQSDCRFLTAGSSVSEISEALSLGSIDGISLVASMPAGAFRGALEMHTLGTEINLLALGPQWSYDGNSWFPQTRFQNQ
ncbi:MAG: hypothetical protein ACREIC_34270, partial [Limisphaerales bacterium]